MAIFLGPTTGPRALPPVFERRVHDAAGPGALRRSEAPNVAFFARDPWPHVIQNKRRASTHPNKVQTGFISHVSLSAMVSIHAARDRARYKYVIRRARTATPPLYR